MFHDVYNKRRYFISDAERIYVCVIRDISFHAIQHFPTRHLLLHRCAHTYVIQMRDLTRHQNPGFTARS